MIRIRRWHQPDCTLGRLSCGDFHCFTLELPFRDNEPNISCIPPGEYTGFIYNSPSNGWCIAIEGVPGRTLIQIHSLNEIDETEGCIGTGEMLSCPTDGRPPRTVNSRKALDDLIERLPDGTFPVRVGS